VPQLITVAAGTPVVGWRAWTIVLQSGAPRLSGLSYQNLPPATVPVDGGTCGQVWTPGTNTAVSIPDAATSPAGFFISKTKGQMAQMPVYGRANGWGTFVADRDDHWGCEKASLVEVFVNGHYSQYVAALAAYYGVPVSVG
jgi:hypothetical protein